MDFIYESNRIFLKNEQGDMIAEVTFPNISDDIVNVNHTYVDDSLRGQGVASMLLKSLADKLRAENKKAYPTCSYAVKWFEKNTDYSDVYTNNIDMN